jgi:hypothetical protein
MKKILTFALVGAFAVALSTTGCQTASMKGSVYVNDNPAKTPMLFTTETLGVLDFKDDKIVAIIFPYAIDTGKINSNFAAMSGEINAEGQYEKTGSTIVVRFKLNDNQKEPGVMSFEMKDDGETLVGKNGGQFLKIDRPTPKN